MRKSINDYTLETYGEEYIERPLKSDDPRKEFHLQAPPLGRFTKQWIQYPCARRETETWALEALKANVEMYERLTREEPDNPHFRDWLDGARADLARLLDWMN